MADDNIADCVNGSFIFAVLKARDLPALYCGLGILIAKLLQYSNAQTPKVWTRSLGATNIRKSEHGNNVNVNKVGRCGVCHVIH